MSPSNATHHQVYHLRIQIQEHNDQLLRLFHLNRHTDTFAKDKQFPVGATMYPGSGLVVENEEEEVVVVDSIDGLLEAFGCVTQ